MQNYNLIHSSEDITDDSPGLVEPVGLQEMKDFMRLESFQDDQSSTADITFSSDDDLIEDIITAAREKVEKYTGCSLIPKNYRVDLTNLAGDIELPFGPIGDLNALYYDGDDALVTNESDDATLSRGEFKQLRCPKREYMVLEYSCGYGRGDTPRLPRALKLAIMAQALNDYEHRGDEAEDAGICKRARELAAPYKRTTWLQ